MGRCGFMKRSAAALAAAFPNIVTAQAWASAPPSDRITLGCIGMGKMMRVHVCSFLGRPHVQILSASSFYRNPALSPDHRKRPPFVNGVLRIHTDLTPFELKHGVLRAIEGRMRRRRTADRYRPRTLDLDLLVYEDLEVVSEELELPDPDISLQPFWAVPLAELIPDFRAPKASLSMKELAHTFDTRSFVYLEAFTAEVSRTLGLGA